MDVINLAKENEALCIKMRRDLHKIPELELELPKTVRYVKERLDEFGIDYIEMINNNAIVANIYGHKKGKCLAVRADMDALPIEEETGLSFKSTHKGRMHACGHDSHTAIALTTAKILNENKDKLKGVVKFIFQPGEEIPGGAKPMIDEGCLKNPNVDYIIGMHGGLIADIPHGMVGFKDKELMASMDRFSIKVKGKAGHGANPQKAIDPILISAEILMALQKIVSREISPVDQAVVSVCKINGGYTQNIIPNEVDMLGTARSLDEKTRDRIENRIKEISDGIAKTYGASAEVLYERFYPVLKNDPDFSNFVREKTREIFPDDIFELDKPTMGSEDMAFYLREVPGSFIFLSNLNKAKDGKKYPNHNPKFDLDETLFYKAIAIFLNVAFGFLS